jgi:hypothetical protein
MTAENLNTIDDYESFLGGRLRKWSARQRLALAAAMAERWLPAYEQFSAAEEWGDPASLRRSLDAVWGHLAGGTLKPADRARHMKQLDDSTPHLDDFDAREAWAACVILGEALDCCGTTDNLAHALQAALSSFEAIVPDWVVDPSAQLRIWQKGGVRRELSKQLKLLDRIGAITQFDGPAVEALRSGLTSPEYAAEIPKQRETAGPTALTNQAAFEQYRRLVEVDLRGKQRPVDFGGGPVLFAMNLFAEWLGRYGRRRDAISGAGCVLADVAGQQALLARQRARDAEAKGLPQWDPEIRSLIDLCMQNSLNRLDVNSLEKPHSYGPSLRWLWAEAKRHDRSDQDAWQSIVAWARHRPAVWELEDRRKEKGLAHTVAALGEYLARAITWSGSDDPEHPWTAEVAGQRWRVRINDFPDDLMYSLVIGDTVIGDFHDWLETWQRP